MPRGWQAQGSPNRHPRPFLVVEGPRGGRPSRRKPRGPRPRARATPPKGTARPKRSTDRAIRQPVQLYAISGASTNVTSFALDQHGPHLPLGGPRYLRVRHHHGASVRKPHLEALLVGNLARTAPGIRTRTHGRSRGFSYRTPKRCESTRAAECRHPRLNLAASSAARSGAPERRAQRFSGAT